MLFVMIFGVYVGAISVAWQQAHIRIDAFLNLAPVSWRRPLHIFSTLVFVGILVPVVTGSFQVVTLLFRFDQRSDALQFPMWIPQGVVPVSLTLIMLLALARVFDPKAPEPTLDEPDRRAAPRRGDARGDRLGEHVVRRLRTVLGDPPHARRRRPAAGFHPPRARERRADGDLLLHGRARGAARVRDRRAHQLVAGRSCRSSRRCRAGGTGAVITS